MTSKQYINFSKKFDELTSDIDDIRDLLMEVLQYNQNIINEISHLRMVNMPCIKAKKKKKSKSKTKHICNTSSGSEFEYEYDEKY